MNTLLDTGSVFSFVKNSYVPEQLIETIDLAGGPYSGINSSELQDRGQVMEKVEFNNQDIKNISLLVVSSKTINSYVVSGTDSLNLFHTSQAVEKEVIKDQTICHILNIEVRWKKDRIFE